MSGIHITLGLIVCLGVLELCNAQCNVMPRRDCYAASNPSASQSGCQGIGCSWCPTTVAGSPWCVDACQTSAASAIDCFVANSIVSQTACTSRGCKWCLGLPGGVPACQTNHRDCLVNGRVDAKSTATAVARQNCEGTAPTGLYCPLAPGVAGPYCIKPQPALANCFLAGRPSTGPTTLYTCHISGGVWCDTSTFNPGRCIALPTTASTTCPTTPRYQCIVNGVTSPTETQCLENGCKWCPLTGQPSCIYGSTPQCTRTTRTNCAATTIVTQAQCTALGCDFCPMTNSFNCIRKNSHPNCALTMRTACAGVNQATVTQLQCAAQGCIYCSDITTSPRCIANPNSDCTSCNCNTKTDCLTEMTPTEASCYAKNCRWCPQSNTSIPNCIVFNNQGISAKGQFTPCTAPCGGGTRWQIPTTCTLPLLQCARVYEDCNVQACPSDNCTGLLLLRYMSNTTRCCFDTTTTSVCGTHSTSNPPTGRRRKRVVGGTDVPAATRWTWMGWVRPTASTICGIVLIKVTASSSVGLSDANCTAGITPGTTTAIFNQLDLNAVAPASNVIVTRTVVGGVAVLTFNTALAPGTTAPPPFPICMPNGEDVIQPSNCYILGWGARTSGGALSNMLIEARMRILPFTVCEQAYPNSTLSEANMICAGVLGTSPDGCLGDEGGPLMCQRCQSCAWYVAGITTPLVGCGTASKPTVFNRISALQAMISAVTNVSPLPETATFSCP